MKYALEIERQNATIEIRTTPAKLRIQSTRPSFTVTRAPAEQSGEQKAGSQPAQNHFEAPSDVVQLSRRFEGYNNGSNALNRMAKSEEETDGNALATLMAQRQAAAAKREAEAAKRQAEREEMRESRREWDPGYVKMSWDAQAMEIQWDVQPLEVEYEPYSVEISMKDYPSLKIRAHAVGHRVDRRI